MHILYIHQHFTTPQGKGGVRSYQMARRLVDRGHRVTMVCGTFDGGNTGITAPFVDGMRRGNVDGIDVIEVNLVYSNQLSFIERSRLFFRFAFVSSRLAMTERYDLIFATTTPLTVAVPGILARWLRRKPFVFEVRDLWPELPKAMGVITNPVVLAAMATLERTAYRSADRVIGLAPGIVEGIRRHGIPADRVVSVPNGCDMDIFASAAPVAIPGVGAGETIAIFTGTHGIANGLDQLLDGAEILQRRGRTDIRIVLVGDGKLKADLIRSAERRKLGNVLFLPPVSKHVLASYLKAADIGVQCLKNIEAFYNGTSPNKFFDYLASGLPVLINYPGWIADMVRTNDSGLAVPPGEPEALATALEQMADDPVRRDMMGRNAQDLARREFDRDVLAARWVQTIEATGPGTGRSAH
ncbi:glycosyltransferase family 4 protein [Sphingomonas sp. PB2P19]|uniref:glycosyltransferase family 4 protein n=1 Tax=Sphingomonas rhamnosi TaxID=3096156 RepID=UPI002FCA1EF4